MIRPPNTNNQPLGRRKLAALSDVKAWLGNDPAISIGVLEGREPAPASLTDVSYLQAFVTETLVQSLDVDRLQHDQQDEARPVGGLHKAADSIEVLTDGLTPEQVVDKLEQLVRQRQRAQS